MPRLLSMALSVALSAVAPSTVAPATAAPSTAAPSTAAQAGDAQTCHFTYRPSQVGDETQQTVESNLRLIVSMHQFGQTIDTFEQTIDRKQTRRFTVLSRNEHRVLSARVVYLASQRTTNTNGKTEPPVEHPVIGKSYVVARPAEHLIITYEDGSRPPEEELKIVRTSVDGIGRPNKLAIFFDGRTLGVGEVLKLPNGLASELMGFRESVGEVTRFEMKLIGIQQSVRHAILDVSIDAGQPEVEGTKLQVRGQVVMEIDTCRTHAAEFSGPVAVTERRGPPGHQFTVSGHGQIQVAIRSERAAGLAGSLASRVSTAANTAATNNTGRKRPR